MSLRIFNSDEPNTFHYVTFVTNKRVPIFQDDAVCRILVDVIDEIRNLHPFKLIGYVIMPDHVHMILNPLKPEISTILRKIKGKSAKLTIDHLKSSDQHMLLKKLELQVKGRRHALWLTRSSDIDILSGKFVRQKLQYIHLNPVRAGFCNDPMDWKWSSFCSYLPNYSGEVPLEVDFQGYWTTEEIEKSRCEG